MAVSVPAGAEGTAPYVSLGPGANWVPYNSPARGTASPPPRYDQSWATIGSVELALTRSWRTDVDITYRRDDRAVGFGGDPYASGMSNILLGIGGGSSWTPYIGAGVGTQRSRPNGLGGPPSGAGDDELARSYQGVLGVSHAVTPNARFFLDYHYVYGNDPLVRDSAGTKRTDSGSSTVLFGMRFTLAPPPPPSNR